MWRKEKQCCWIWQNACLCLIHRQNCSRTVKCDPLNIPRSPIPRVLCWVSADHANYSCLGIHSAFQLQFEFTRFSKNLELWIHVTSSLGLLPFLQLFLSKCKEIQITHHLWNWHQTPNQNFTSQVKISVWNERAKKNIQEVRNSNAGLVRIQCTHCLNTKWQAIRFYNFTIII